jgi:MFS family permease
MTLGEASFVLTAYGLGAATGRITAGTFSDRLGGFTTIRAGYALQILALIALWWVPSWAALLGSLVVFGVGLGASDTMLTRVIPDVFGVRSLGAIMGVLSLGWRSGAALGPATAGFLYDLTGSYAVPFAASPLVVLASWGLFVLGSRRGRA